ncbi:17456_t:CDS:1, partial [Funneliformis geosporum]
LKLYEIMKDLTPKTRGAIIYGKKCRQSGHTIAKNLGCSKTAVYNTLKRL